MKTKEKDSDWLFAGYVAKKIFELDSSNALSGGSAENVENSLEYLEYEKRFTPFAHWCVVWWKRLKSFFHRGQKGFKKFCLVRNNTSLFAKRVGLLPISTMFRKKYLFFRLGSKKWHVKKIFHQFYVRKFRNKKFKFRKYSKIQIFRKYKTVYMV